MDIGESAVGFLMVSIGMDIGESAVFDFEIGESAVGFNWNGNRRKRRA